MEYCVLPWDSDFFGFGVARAVNPSTGKDWSDLKTNLQKDHIRLAYLFCDRKPETIGNQLMGWKPIEVDEKLTYVKNELAERPLRGICKITKRDEPSLSRQKLHSLAILSGRYSRFRVDPLIPGGKFEELYRLWIDGSLAGKPDELLLAASHDGEVAGFVTVTFNRIEARIGLIAVDEAWQGKGIGKQLMLAAENEAVRRGIDVLKVVTQACNEAACNLYLKSGFRMAGKEYIYHLWKA